MLKVIIFLMMKGYANKLLLLLLTLLVFDSAAAGQYLWPVAAGKKLSSSFFEFREGHLHAGIDIRSFGEVGLPCYAVRSGYVERVKIQPYGYGKALYLRLSDGNTAVYAHLYGFGAEIDSLVYARMTAAANPWCDIHLPRGKYSYSAGETVAYAGRSGTRAAHLHFELRDSRGRPFNPLIEKYTVPDNIPPVIHSVEVTPLTGGSMINGEFSSAMLSFERTPGGVYQLSDTLQLSGVIGFGLSAWDRQAQGIYRMEPFSCQLTVDGDTLYSLENRIFSYYQSSDVKFEFNDYGEGWKKRFKNLYRKEGNSLPDRYGSGVVSGSEGYRGEIEFDNALHRADITVSDISGNVSRGRFYFHVHSYPGIVNARKLETSSEVIISSSDPDGGPVMQKLYESTDGGNSWSELQVEDIGSYSRAMVSASDQATYKYSIIDDEGMRVSGTFSGGEERVGKDMVFADCSLFLEAGSVILDIRTDRILASPPGVEVYPGNSPAGLIQIEDRRYSARFNPASLSDGENLFRVSGTDHRGYSFEKYFAAGILLFRSGRELSWSSSDSVSLDFESSSVTGTAPCVIGNYSAFEADSSRKPVIFPFSLDFQEDSFLEPLRIFSNAGDRTGLYRYDAEDSSWSCLGPAGREDGITISRSGIYALFKDGLPPRIGKIGISSQPRGSGFFRDYSYYITVDDTGSGIDPYSAEVFWNNRWMVSHWDDIRGRLYIPVPSSLSEREISLKVAISDKIGNRSVEDFSFVIK